MSDVVVQIGHSLIGTPKSANLFFYESLLRPFNLPQAFAYLRGVAGSIHCLELAQGLAEQGQGALTVAGFIIP